MILQEEAPQSILAYSSETAPKEERRVHNTPPKSKQKRTRVVRRAYRVLGKKQGLSLKAWVRTIDNPFGVAWLAAKRAA